MKTADTIKQIHTVNYLYQSDEINYDELETRMAEILESYAKEHAIDFGIGLSEIGPPREVMEASYNYWREHGTML